MATNLVTLRKGSGLQIFCKKKDRERESDRYPYKVIEITPPPKILGIRCFPSLEKESFVKGLQLELVKNHVVKQSDSLVKEGLHNAELRTIGFPLNW
ncbi:hypothetical protein AAC387_Pa03g0454 [Persea americana]